MLQYLPLPAAQEVRDSSSVVAPCIVMKNGGVLYHQVSSFSPGHRTKIVLQELAQLSAFTVCLRGTARCINIIRHNEHHLQSTLCRAHFL